MDKTRVFILYIVMVLLIVFAWPAFQKYEFDRHPEWIKPDQAAQTGAVTPSSQPANMGVITTIPTTQTAISATQTAEVARQTVLGSDDFSNKQFVMGLSLNSKGAAVDSVILNRFRAEADSDQLFQFQTPYPGDLGDKYRPMGVYAATVDGQRIELWDKNWHTDGPVVGANEATQVFDLVVAQDGADAVTLTETITVPRVDVGNPGNGGYEVLVTYGVENHSTQAHTVKLDINGPTVPRATTSRDIPTVLLGYNGNGAITMNPDSLTVSGLSTKPDAKSPDPKDLTTSTAGLNLMWYGSSSNYFCAIFRPDDAAKISGFTATGLGQDPDTKDGFVALQAMTGSKPTHDDPAGAGMTVAPNSSQSVTMHDFFGPKQRLVLNVPYYTQFPMQYDKALLTTTGRWCAFLMWDWFATSLFWMLWAFHFVLRDWGLAIIALVCLVRLILHPITRRSQVSMMKMQKLAPEMERLKKKFGDDSKGFQQAQMELYKEMGFTPVLGCLPMFLQMPVFFNLYAALLSTFELRQAPFLRFGWLHLTWIRDLSEPDNLIKFSAPITLPFGWHMSGINVLPVLMAVVTFMNQKYLMPPPSVQTPEQEQQRKMMTYTSLLFPLMFYAVPSGLNLYYLTSTGLGIIESWLIRKHIKEREAMEKAGKEFVEVGKATRASRSKKYEPAFPVKKGGIAGWFADLQARVEEMRKQGPPGRGRN